MNPLILNIQSQDFEKHLANNSGIIMLDVYAEWCGPCRQLAPILDEISVEYENKIKILKLNADENKEFVKQLNIRGLPTMLIFRETKEIERIVGFASKKQLIEDLEKYI
ncbi:thioredoxin [Acinetobacter seifertii]|uniref:thioredoxin n=1 Tax=Acinetobacter seifertii TaxID=1530123 RepID=UPI001C0D9A29|nr:thioredoxin [Acinetobacter seifertii]MBU3084667.1 thioredoxin [Acinetobacter seifertii]